ncbi:MAG TPA: hypothetical protein VNQ90_13965 [Chthoniobacteraceae bacterium]|nr:hypothetical protein [Chthoniobacteraceae bacterium]
MNRANFPLCCFPRSAAILFLALMMKTGTGTAAPLIDLSRPVDESLEIITGVYWSFDALSVDGAVVDEKTSGAKIDGTPAQGHGSAPSLVGGVNLAGTSGFGQALALRTNATQKGGDGNPRVVNNALPLAVGENPLAMVATDFTGGLWIRFDSILSGATQSVVLMDRGMLGIAASGGENGGNWGFYLEKDTEDLWRVAFQTGDGTSTAAAGTVYHDDFEALPFGDGGWHHIGFSFLYGGEEGGHQVQFWLDGTLLNTVGGLDVSITSGSTTRSGVRRFWVGERATTGYWSVFDGDMDDLFVTHGQYGFQPIPEPSGMALLAGGLALLWPGLRSWRTRFTV